MKKKKEIILASNGLFCMYFMCSTTISSNYMTKLNPNFTTLYILINNEGHGYCGAINVGK